ncbi:winged helix-turn-helix transcriptional regulator [Chitinophaga ginsengisoli]|uniref:HxlR family transcriptional regulator n=1 Tax=Chitinophaga ginsengisoli TaxID=363837 RepID=A0A2P8G2N3_9BACT|nr:helix-turn-helix domain-containing protein [Chitinophaga ginsengisoli]PSL28135.1 HxlR family transcriptional regulator [Chitinophaga ginsengisoli]
MKEIEPRSTCPVSYTLDFFGDKWSLLIMRDMMLNNKSTYGEFLNSDEKIATNILADRLNMLEAYGFVTKKVAADKKSKFVYHLTEKGIELVPVVLEIALWGAKYHPSGMDRELSDALETDKAGTILRIQNLLRNKFLSFETI